MNKILITVCFFLFLLAIPVSSANDIYDNPKKFATYNPDGRKYDFVKHYLTALEYLQKNQERQLARPSFTDENLARKSFIKSEMDELLQQNANLRVARNMIKKYLTSENGLMLKAVTLFSDMCDQLIVYNNVERKMLDQFFERLEDKSIDAEYFEKFKQKLSINQNNRKSALAGILEASLFTSKVLVSAKLNRYNELTHLGITERERKKLLLRLQKFSGDNFSGQLREGQSFVEGSVAVIREMLENESFQSLGS